MKNVCLIQASLRSNSNTSIVCDKFSDILKAKKIKHKIIDLRDINLEFCDWRSLDNYNNDLKKSYETMKDSQIIIFGMPVYQYSLSWVLKNFIDICWWSLVWKDIWVLVNSWWPNCYMASRDIFDMLYYEYKTRNISPTPFTWSCDFSDWNISNDKVIEKLEELGEVIKSM